MMNFARKYELGPVGGGGYHLYIDGEPFPYVLADAPLVDSDEQMSEARYHILWVPVFIGSPAPKFGIPDGDPIGA